jgi:cation-transporting P-type ATPase E
LAIGIPGFFLALGPSQERFHPGFVGRVLRFAVPAGLMAAAAVLVAYGLARAENVAPNQARTAASIVFFVVSLWVLVVQARPMRAWKGVLVAAMAGLFVLVIEVPAARRFYLLEPPPVEIQLEALAIGALASMGVEALWRLIAAQRFRRRVPV